MAPSFVRSISFPLIPARSSKPRHFRSISLPCSSDPLLARLNAHIAAIRSWIKDPSTPASGLAHIHALHTALADILLLQEPMDALRQATKTGDRLLDAFLLLADAHQCFQEALLELKHTAAEARATCRRGDAGRAASAARSQRRAEKEISRLATSASVISTKIARNNIIVSDDDTEMASALMEAASAVAAASATVFSVAASMSSLTSSCKKTSMLFPTFARKATMPEMAEVTVDGLHALEQCFQECEGICEKVFMSIVQTRVSLLNIMTPAI